MKGSYKFLMVFVTLFIFQSRALAWNEYSDLAVGLVKNIDVLLVEHHVCENINKCRSLERVYGGGSPDIAKITVFKADDLDRETIQGIMKLCLDAYVLHGRKQSIILRVYRETREEQVAWFSGVKPFIYLEMKGEQ